LNQPSNAQSPLYVFAGGGTGGHLAPGIAVAEQLRLEQPDCRIRFVGSGRPVERQMLAPTSFEYTSCETLPLTDLRRRPNRFVWSHWKAFREACRSIRKDRPSAIIGLGGFASVPFAVAARKCGVPCILLEQNTVPGMANRWLSRWHPICLTFVESASHLPRKAIYHVTGNPLRRDVCRIVAANYALPLEHPTLLVLGGSLGSRQINDSVLAAIEQCASALAGWNILHQTGPEGSDAARRLYSELGISHVVSPFFSDLPARLGDATLTVARAGATTLAELAAVGIPAILVPYPTAADDHQTRNAQLFVESGAAVMVTPPDRSFAPVDLVPVLKPLLVDQPQLLKMSLAMKTLSKPNAAAEVVAILKSLIP
jgi:UDP-N-acetylglucosamine--N-acetylmuramyl-(pentapeptide) pyrophosphoryl-undecaprenol N-acetylglucosamine transferase